MTEISMNDVPLTFSEDDFSDIELDASEYYKNIKDFSIELNINMAPEDIYKLYMCVNKRLPRKLKKRIKRGI